MGLSDPNNYVEDVFSGQREGGTNEVCAASELPFKWTVKGARLQWDRTEAGRGDKPSHVSRNSLSALVVLCHWNCFVSQSLTGSSCVQ